VKIAENNAMLLQKMSEQLNETMTLNQQVKQAMEVQLTRFQNQLQEELEAFKTETEMEVKKQ
jgi:hypothetical protein